MTPGVGKRREAGGGKAGRRASVDQTRRKQRREISERRALKRPDTLTLNSFSLMASRYASSLRAVSRWQPFTRLAARPSMRRMATATTASPAAPADPALSKLVDDISSLTLLQAADLVSLLKTRLNIQEIAMPAAAPVAVPVAAEDAPVEKPKEKTIFNVKLDAFTATSKPKIIKEVKALVPNLTLIDAKKFVESLPKILKENLPKEDAEKIKATFEALGGVVVLE
ncbi:ribosomal protein L7/L12 C-terminal domain-containing protein [Amylostereum chailletii]|nr:ribosomal protein L7/L12 C-terminal domain-containing protein [Amylostereum chailletii]